jgi:hypothetical protein
MSTPLLLLPRYARVLRVSKRLTAGLFAERVDEVSGKTIGLHIQNSGQKLWVFDLLSEQPVLAGLAANPRVRSYIEEMVPDPVLGLLAARFQWRGAESHIHGSRDDISLSPTEGPEAGGNYSVERSTDEPPRLRTSAFRLMYMLSDIEPGGGALRVIPGSHKRDVPWQPAGVRKRAAGNTRYEELSEEQKRHFVELTGKAGTAVIFTHDLIHCSWHETDSYRRVVHLTFSQGGAGATLPVPSPHDAHEAADLNGKEEAVGSDSDDYLRLLEGEAGVAADVEPGASAGWLQYLMREREAFVLPPAGTNLNYVVTPPSPTSATATTAAAATAEGRGAKTAKL